MFKNLLSKLVKKNNSEEVRDTQLLHNENVSTSTIQHPTPKITPPKLEVLLFNVAGVTAKNEQNQDIQKLLRQKGKLYAKENGYELFGGYKNKEIIEDFLEVSEFEDLFFSQHEISFVPEPTNEYDANAINIFIIYDEVPLHIGYVPKKINVELKTILDNEDLRRIEGRYVGGKIKSLFSNRDIKGL